MVDKIAEGMSMFLSGPAPSFAGVGLKLASQAVKGVKDTCNIIEAENKADVTYWAFWEAPPRSGTNSERTRGIREWAQKVPQAVTTDVLLLGKYESPMQTTSILGEYSQGSQSFQTTRVIGTRQRRSDQWHERDGVEFVKEQNSRQTSHAQQTQAS